MIYGGTDEEKISLNHEELWSGLPADSRTRLRAGADAVFKRVRDLTLSEKRNEAERMAEEGINGAFTSMYLPLGSLHIKYNSNKAADQYSRVLNMDTGTVNVTVGNSARRYFVPYKTSSFVMKLSGEAEFTLSFISALKHTMKAEGDRIVIAGECPIYMLCAAQNARNEDIHGYNGKGIKFTGIISVVSDGTVIYYDDNIEVSGANESVVYFTCASSFVNYDKLPDAPSRMRASRAHNMAVKKGYENLLDMHIKTFSSMYNRVKLNISSASDTETDTLQRLKNAGHSPAMVELLFNFGRYLTISSAAPGTHATNLQGIWNEKMYPNWNSGYTTNINTEMNYWPVLPCALPECYTSLIELIQNLSESGKECARDIYDAPGFVAHHNTDIWAQAEPVGDRTRGSVRWGFWNMSSGWMMEHLFEYYEYTLDRKFLKDTAFPIMKSAAEFYLSQLIVYEDRLIFCPATSPENSYEYNGETYCLAKWTTMSQTIIFELFTNCRRAYKILGLKKDKFFKEITKAIPRLKPFSVSESGRMLEWDQDYQESDIHHRHVSHLYGVYPAGIISTESTPELAEACKKSLLARGDEGTGWSLAWKANLWARLKDGDHALKLIYRQLELIDPKKKGSWQHGGTYPNMLDAHPPFQIDGNFGITAAIAQLFLQCEDNEIKLLPALPSDFGNGSISGLTAKGNVRVDIEWSSGGNTTVTLQSPFEQTVTVSCRGIQKKVAMKKGEKKKTVFNFNELCQK